jgi:protein-disulfide isomerase
LSEQLPSDTALPDVPDVEPIEELPVETTEPSAAPSRPKWIAPAWFFLGIIVGIVGFATFNAIVASKTAAPQAAPVDSAAMRNAARSGVLEAIATLQAGGGQQPAAQESQEPQTVAADAFTLRAANRLGDPNAKITIVEFSDFQCPFCERFHQTVETQLRQQYVDTGKVAFVYKHSAFLGQESVWAAQAAECAADQGKFWEFHDMLFAKQNGENTGTFTKDNLLKYAKELNGLDIVKFEPCLKNDETLQRVSGDTQEGGQAGVRGTPTFFINGKPLVGAQPLQVFQQQIDAVLGN